MTSADDDRLRRLESRMFAQRVITAVLAVVAVIAVARDVYFESRLTQAHEQIESMRDAMGTNTNAAAVLGTRMNAVEEIIRTSPALRR